MTSRERVLRTLERLPVDRVPMNYMANGGIDARLKAHYGLEPHDGEGLLRKLGVDFRGVGAWYSGPKLFEDIPERGVLVSEWGIHRRWIEHGTGGYWDFCDFPLKDATLDTVRNRPYPSPDDFTYDRVASTCDYYDGQFCLVTGSPGIGDIMNCSGMLFGVEEMMVRMATGDDAWRYHVDRYTEILLEYIKRTLEAAKGKIDILWMGEDLGTQHTPLISLDLFRREIRPRHQPFIDLARRYGIRVMTHTCGCSSWAYPDFIEMGVDIVDTLQPEATHMDPAYLTSRFGKQLAFHGCISTAIVSQTDVDGTLRHLRDTLAAMQGYAYCLCPTHLLQDNTPTENVVALYAAATSA
ncbi:MAG: hypothetical protein FWF84_06640 [Kiritimatiellaeota bacterium]|nr:hypothetical protein [Kiritimatiellota bacterium]